MPGAKVAYSDKAGHHSAMKPISIPGGWRSPSECSDAGLFHDPRAIGMTRNTQCWETFRRCPDQHREYPPRTVGHAQRLACFSRNQGVRAVFLMGRVSIAALSGRWLRQGVGHWFPTIRPADSMPGAPVSAANSLTSTRRFSTRPFRVELSAIGFVFPRPTTWIRYSGTFPVVMR